MRAIPVFFVCYFFQSVCKTFYGAGTRNYFCGMLKAMLRAAGIFYFAVLFYIFFLARRRPRPSFNRHLMPHNIVPLKHKFEDAALYHTMRDIDKWNFITDLAGNIILFIPLPFFLALIFNIRGTAKLLLVSFVVSFVVETCQYFLGIGVADVDDVILNTLGACIGVVFLKLIIGYRMRYRSAYAREKKKAS